MLSLFKSNDVPITDKIRITKFVSKTDSTTIVGDWTLETDTVGEKYFSRTVDAVEEEKNKFYGIDYINCIIVNNYGCLYSEVIEKIDTETEEDPETGEVLKVNTITLKSCTIRGKSNLVSWNVRGYVLEGQNKYFSGQTIIVFRNLRIYPYPGLATLKLGTENNPVESVLIENYEDSLEGILVYRPNCTLEDTNSSREIIQSGGSNVYNDLSLEAVSSYVALTNDPDRYSTYPYIFRPIGYKEVYGYPKIEVTYSGTKYKCFVMKSNNDLKELYGWKENVEVTKQKNDGYKYFDCLKNPWEDEKYRPWIKTNSNVEQLFDNSYNGICMCEYDTISGKPNAIKFCDPEHTFYGRYDFEYVETAYSIYTKAYDTIVFDNIILTDYVDKNEIENGLISAPNMNIMVNDLIKFETDNCWIDAPKVVSCGHDVEKLYNSPEIVQKDKDFSGENATGWFDRFVCIVKDVSEEGQTIVDANKFVVSENVTNLYGVPELIVQFISESKQNAVYKISAPKVTKLFGPWNISRQKDRGDDEGITFFNNNFNITVNSEAELYFYNTNKVVPVYEYTLENNIVTFKRDTVDFETDNVDFSDGSDNTVYLNGIETSRGVYEEGNYYYIFNNLILGDGVKISAPNSIIRVNGNFEGNIDDIDCVLFIYKNTAIHTVENKDGEDATVYNNTLYFILRNSFFSGSDTPFNILKFRLNTNSTNVPDYAGYGLMYEDKFEIPSFNFMTMWVLYDTESQAEGEPNAFESNIVYPLNMQTMNLYCKNSSQDIITEIDFTITKVKTKNLQYNVSKPKFFILVPSKFYVESGTVNIIITIEDGAHFKYPVQHLLKTDKPITVNPSSTYNYIIKTRGNTYIETTEINSSDFSYGVETTSETYHSLRSKPIYQMKEGDGYMYFKDISVGYLRKTVQGDNPEVDYYNYAVELQQTWYAWRIRENFEIITVNENSIGQLNFGWYDSNNVTIDGNYITQYDCNDILTSSKTFDQINYVYYVFETTPINNFYKASSRENFPIQVDDVIIAPGINVPEDVEMHLEGVKVNSEGGSATIQGKLFSKTLTIE